MRIGINARLFEDKNKTGVPIGVQNDLKSWNEKHPENEYFLFSRNKIHLDFLPGKNWHIIERPLKIDAVLSPKNKLISKFFGFMYNAAVLPVLIKKHKIDAFWGPSFFLPPKVKGTRYYVTVHDMAAYRFRETVTFHDAFTHKLFMPMTCRSADRIITVSNSSARDICKYLGVKKNKIFVSYSSGVWKAPDNIAAADITDIPPALRPKGRYILFISTIEPRKNVYTLIKAFEKYMDKYGDDDLYLILAGGRGWKCEEIYNAAETSRYKERIIMPGYISDKEKAFLLSNAAAFAYPSLYEGFGVPVLEAFAYHLPLVTTKTSSLPEVAGDAALYISDPFDADELCTQLRRALTLPDEERLALNKKMDRQLGKFSWEKNAEEIMGLFKSMHSKRRSR